MPALPFVITRSRVVTGLIAATLVLIGALLIAPAAGQGTGSKPTGLRVMTFDIQHGAGADGDVDLTRAAAVIEVEHPDVVALQEVDDAWSARSDFVDQVGALAHHLNVHAYFAPIYDEAPLTSGSRDRRFGVAFLSRYEITSAQNHFITRRSTQVAGATAVPGPGFAEISIKVGGTAVHVYNTQLDTAAAVRAAQVRDMLQFLQHDAAPKVLMGSFDAAPEAAELQPLFTDLHDVFTQLNEPHPASYPADAPARAVDFILVSAPLRATGAQVVDTIAAGHRPVVADLTLSGG